MMTMPVYTDVSEDGRALEEFEKLNPGREISVPSQSRDTRVRVTYPLSSVPDHDGGANVIGDSDAPLGWELDYIEFEKDPVNVIAVFVLCEEYED